MQLHFPSILSTLVYLISIPVWLLGILVWKTHFLHLVWKTHFPHLVWKTSKLNMPHPKGAPYFMWRVGGYQAYWCNLLFKRSTREVRDEGQKRDFVQWCRIRRALDLIRAPSSRRVSSNWELLFRWWFSSLFIDYIFNSFLPKFLSRFFDRNVFIIV